MKLRRLAIAAACLLPSTVVGCGYFAGPGPTQRIPEEITLEEAQYELGWRLVLPAGPEWQDPGGLLDTKRGERGVLLTYHEAVQRSDQSEQPLVFTLLQGPDGYVPDLAAGAYRPTKAASRRVGRFDVQFRELEGGGVATFETGEGDIKAVLFAPTGEDAARFIETLR